MTAPRRRAGSRGETIEVIFDTETIRRRIEDLAEEIVTLGTRDLLVVSILKGSFVFAADLIRALHAADLEPEVDFIFLASYGTGTQSSGRVAVLRDIESPVEGRIVLLIDDILESGHTLAFAKQLLERRGAARVATCVLVDKPDKRAADVEADFRGFVCPDIFVVGYGMDLAHRFRELPFVGRVVT